MKRAGGKMQWVPGKKTNIPGQRPRQQTVRPVPKQLRGITLSFQKETQVDADIASAED